MDTQLHSLIETANRYGENDYRRIVAIAIDLVNAIIETRVPNSKKTDEVLLNLISNYILQIEKHWS